MCNSIDNTNVSEGFNDFENILTNYFKTLSHKNKYDNIFSSKFPDISFEKKNKLSLFELSRRKKKKKKKKYYDDERDSDYEDDYDYNRSYNTDDYDDEYESFPRTKKKYSSFNFLRKYKLFGSDYDDNNNEGEIEDDDSYRHKKSKHHKHRKKKKEGNILNSENNNGYNNGNRINDNNNNNNNMNSNNNNNMNNNNNNNVNNNNNNMNNNNNNNVNNNNNNTNNNNNNMNNNNNNINNNNNNINNNNNNMNNNNNSINNNNNNNNNMNNNNNNMNNNNNNMNSNSNNMNINNNNNSNSGGTIASNGNSTVNSNEANTQIYGSAAVGGISYTDPLEEGNISSNFSKLINENFKFITTEMICNSINCNSIDNSASEKIPLSDCTNITYCSNCAVSNSPKEQCDKIKNLNSENILVSSGFIDSANLYNKNNLINIPFNWSNLLFDFSKCIPDINKFKLASKQFSNKDKNEAFKYLFRLANLYIYATKIIEDNNSNPLKITIKFNNINVDSLKQTEHLKNEVNSVLPCPLNIYNFTTFNIHLTQSFAFYQRLFIPENNLSIDSKNLNIEIINDQGYNVGNYFFYAKIDCPKTSDAIENEIKQPEAPQYNLQSTPVNDSKEKEQKISQASTSSGTFEVINNGSSLGSLKKKSFAYKNVISYIISLICMVFYFAFIN